MNECYFVLATPATGFRLAVTVGARSVRGGSNTIGARSNFSWEDSLEGTPLLLGWSKKVGLYTIKC